MPLYWGSSTSEWLVELISAFKFTWSAAFLVLLLAHFRGRRRLAHSSPDLGSSRQGLRYYWPAYFWGLEAVLKFRGSMGYDIAGPPSAATILATTMSGWSAVARSATVLLLIILFSGLLSYFYRRPRVPQPEIGVPIFIIAIAAGVFVYQIGFLLLFYQSVLVSQ